MALKLMVFIDGCWFYDSRQTLFRLAGEENFEIDYKQLAALAQTTLGNSLGLNVDLVRTFYFGLLPLNKPGYNPMKQRTFYEFLADQCGLKADVTEIDFHIESGFSEHASVGVTLAATAMQYAMTPGAVDVLCFMGGDVALKELSNKIRQIGKRTILVSFRNPETGTPIASPSLLATPSTFDFPTIFLDDHVKTIRLVRKEQKRACKMCNAEEVTTWAGPEFFCAKCRTEHHLRTRTCDTCGAEEETTWDKSFFYCSKCRRQHRETR